MDFDSIEYNFLSRIALHQMLRVLRLIFVRINVQNYDCAIDDSNTIHR